MNSFIKNVLFSIALPCFWLEATSAGAVAVNERLPATQVQDENGNLKSLSELSGKVTYVDFWASWCAPCQESLPWMNTLVEKFAARGLSVVAISVDQKRCDADKTIKRVAPNFRVMFDPKGEAAKAFSLPSMPTSFLVDERGAVRVVHRGFKSADRAEIEQRIDELLSEKAS